MILLKQSPFIWYSLKAYGSVSSVLSITRLASVDCIITYLAVLVGLLQRACRLILKRGFSRQLHLVTSIKKGCECGCTQHEIWSHTQRTQPHTHTAIHTLNCVLSLYRMPCSLLLPTSHTWLLYWLVKDPCRYCYVKIYGSHSINRLPMLVGIFVGFELWKKYLPNPCG